MKDHSVRLSTVLSSPCLIQPYTFIADAVSQGNSHLLILHPVKYWGTGSMLRSQFSMFRLGRMKRIILRTSTWPSPEDCKPLLALTSLRWRVSWLVSLLKGLAVFMGKLSPGKKGRGSPYKTERKHAQKLFSTNSLSMHFTNKEWTRDDN